MRQENMILGQLRFGERQTTSAALATILSFSVSLSIHRSNKRRTFTPKQAFLWVFRYDEFLKYFPQISQLNLLSVSWLSICWSRHHRLLLSNCFPQTCTGCKWKHKIKMEVYLTSEKGCEIFHLLVNFIIWLVSFPAVFRLEGSITATERIFHRFN